jgi:hypothetical protein
MATNEELLSLLDNISGQPFYFHPWRVIKYYKLEDANLKQKCMWLILKDRGVL